MAGSYVQNCHDIFYPSSSSASLDPISIRFRRDKSSSSKYIAAYTSHSSNHGQQKKERGEAKK